MEGSAGALRVRYDPIVLWLPWWMDHD
jgi:hypothetical protein